MTSKIRSAPKNLAGHELVIARVFDAPRRLVWTAWTDPRHVREWLGPPHHPATHYENDFRVGGAWRACLAAADGGGEYWEHGVYEEIVPEERLVFTMRWDPPHPTQGCDMRVTLAFAEKDGKTHMRFHQECLPSAEDRDSHEDGWSGSFDRLDAHLAKLAQGAV